jgi:hypothetical protein
MFDQIQHSILGQRAMFDRIEHLIFVKERCSIGSNILFCAKGYVEHLILGQRAMSDRSEHSSSAGKSYVRSDRTCDLVLQSYVRSDRTSDFGPRAMFDPIEHRSIRIALNCIVLQLEERHRKNRRPRPSAPGEQLPRNYIGKPPLH